MFGLFVSTGRLAVSSVDAVFELFEPCVPHFANKKQVDTTTNNTILNMPYNFEIMEIKVDAGKNYAIRVTPKAKNFPHVAESCLINIFFVGLFFQIA